MSECLTIAELYQVQLGALGGLGATVTVTYYPVVLSGYSTSTQERSPAQGSGVAVVGIFGEERITGPDGAITHFTTFAFSPSAYAGEPSPGDRVVAGGVSYRVVEIRRAWFGNALANYVVTLGN
jgi:hypothetical protein